MSKGLLSARIRASLVVFGCAGALSLVAVAGAQGGSTSNSGAPAASSGGDALAVTAKKRRACRPRAIRAIHNRKRKRIRRRDCRDLRIGKPENPRRQRYDGKRIKTPNSARCDFLDAARCLQPWPNDYFTVADSSTTTNRRLNINRESMPENNLGVNIDPTDWNRSDGFSPTSTIVAKVPGLESQTAFNKSGLVPVTDMSKFDDAGQPAVVINTATNQRNLVWAELDGNTTGAKVNLLIHPGKALLEGGHYVVALRSLKTAGGKTIAPPKTFRVYRDRLITRQKPIERRRKQMESLFRELKSNGIKRGNLYAAWDFTVGSEDSISGRMLAMRNDALSNDLSDPDIGNGDVDDGDGPFYSITDVLDVGDPDPDGGGPKEPPTAPIIRNVYGTLDDVPCYLNTNGCPTGSQFAYSSAGDRTPNHNGAFTYDIPFQCMIPSSVINGTMDDIIPARMMMFGHGLLGSYHDVDSGAQRALADEHNIVVCAVDWSGFASEDTDTAIDILGDLSKFPQLVDRTQQGYLGFIYLGRAMTHTNEGFAAGESAFEIDPDGGGGAPEETAIDPSQLFFQGISQGAVLGGGMTAVNPDIDRATLNVGGMSYSNLLPRSSDWPLYEAFLDVSYPDLSERPLILSLLQTLWDRGETAGYAAHALSDEYAETPPKEILHHIAYGDHQVSNLMAEVEARTMGMPVYNGGPTPNGNILDPGRHWAVNPMYMQTAIPSFPWAGSGLVYWDGGPLGFSGTLGMGTAPAPINNTDPTAAFGADPHSYPRNSVEARQLVSDFFDGAFGACAGGDPCYSNGFTGAP